MRSGANTSSSLIVCFRRVSGGRTRVAAVKGENCFRAGYFDPKRKKPLPLYPRCVCLIASQTGRRFAI